MAKLTFDELADRKVVAGVDHAVLYKKTVSGDTITWGGVAWNGFTSFEKSNDGGDATTLWADNIAYLKLRGRESFAGTINCYTFPKEFYPCIGATAITVGDSGPSVYAHEQEHEVFRLCYREVLYDGNGQYGWRYHVLYNLTAGPSDETAETLDDSIDPQEFSFDVEGTPVAWSAKSMTACEWTFDLESLNEDTATGTVKGWIDTLYGNNASTSAKTSSCPDPAALFV